MSSVAAVAEPTGIWPGRGIQRCMVLGIALSVFGLALGGSTVAFVGEAAALAAAVTSIVIAPRPFSPQLRLTVVAIAGLLVIYLIGAMGNNYPGAFPLLLGLRKSLVVWVFLATGAVWPERYRLSTAKCLVRLLGVAAVTSLLLHAFAPAREQAISRAAGVYTQLYAGHPRLQGVFAGPFHAALAGIILVIVAVGWQGAVGGLFARSALLLLGGLLIWETNVRSAWLAVAAGGLAVIAFLPSGFKYGRGVRAVAVVGAVLIFVPSMAGSVVRDNSALASLGRWQEDSRLSNRVEDWRIAAHAVAERPEIGWGAGSAGDTLDRYFPPPLFHVTSHNLLVKYAVETGVVGLGLIICMLVAAFAALTRSRSTDPSSRATALALLIGLLVFGATGSAVDAVPVSWVLAFLVGAGFYRTLDQQSHKAAL